MVDFLKKVWVIVWKDLVIELRTKEMFSAMFIFSLLVVIIFNFAFARNFRWCFMGRI